MNTSKKNAKRTLYEKVMRAGLAHDMERIQRYYLTLLSRDSLLRILEEMDFRIDEIQTEYDEDEEKKHFEPTLKCRQFLYVAMEKKPAYDDDYEYDPDPNYLKMYL
uniref:Uncharacterized protein n=1 Tax=viral metagenome TaxID=1070528 RepID=A0A6C0ITJ1_9ZZZZ